MVEHQAQLNQQSEVILELSMKCGIFKLLMTSGNISAFYEEGKYFQLFMRKGNAQAINVKGKYVNCVSMTNSAGWTGHVLTPEEKQGGETEQIGMRWT